MRTKRCSDSFFHHSADAATGSDVVGIYAGAHDEVRPFHKRATIELVSSPSDIESMISATMTEWLTNRISHP